jgi:hypothetical protein
VLAAKFCRFVSAPMPIARVSTATAVKDRIRSEKVLKRLSRYDLYEVSH